MCTHAYRVHSQRFEVGTRVQAPGASAVVPLGPTISARGMRCSLGGYIVGPIQCVIGACMVHPRCVHCAPWASVHCALRHALLNMCFSVAHS